MRPIRDVLLGAMLCVPALWAAFTSDLEYRLTWWLASGFAIGIAAGIALARAKPWTALSVGVALWVMAVAAGNPFVGFAAMAVLAYLNGVRTEPRGFLAVAEVVALSLAVPLLTRDAGAWFVSVAGIVLGAVVPWLAGRARRQYVIMAREGWQRAEELERAQRVIAEQARAHERTRIAGDMHDLLGHELSLIALRIGGLEVTQGLEEPYREAAGDARRAVTAAAQRLQDIVSLLHQDDPGTVEVPDLVAHARTAGLVVDLRAEGEGPPPEAMAERALRRIVQEGLTNAAKHAPGARVSVVVEHLEDEIAVTVTNDRARTRGPEVPTGGRGLEGLRERVLLSGGTLRAGPSGDGFELSARLPRRPGGPVRSSDSSLRLASARRRAHRTRSTAIATAAAGASVVTTLALGFTVYDSVTSALSPAVFQSLRLGEAQAVVDAELPARTRLDNGPPGPEGARCRFFGTHVNPFDEVRRELYRVCFRDGRLISKDFLPHS